MKRLVFCTFWRDVSLVQGEKFPPVNCKVPGLKQVALMGLKKDPVFSLIPPFFSEKLEKRVWNLRSGLGEKKNKSMSHNENSMTSVV